MADYVPNTIIRICKDVPLDNTYSDVLKFAGVGAQSAYFAGKAKYTFNQMTYQRVNNSVGGPRIPRSVRVPTVADNLYDCNYVMFQNTNYGSKWFYGFIQQVNYINPENTEIIYELDWYQTFQFDFEVMPSLVEREHAVSDGLYENLMPEAAAQADLYTQETHTFDLQTGRYIMVGVTTDPSGQTVAGSMMGGVYTGVEIHTFTDGGSATSFIQEYDTKAKNEAIMTIFMSPFPAGGVPLESHYIERPTSINGYIPKNKKLFTYPYCCLELCNRQGQTHQYYYEYFSSVDGDTITAQQPRFNTIAYGGLNPVAYCVAVNYAGDKGKPPIDYENVQEISGFPTCCWVSDAYENWKNGERMSQALQNTVATVTDGISSLASSATGAASAAAGMGGGGGNFALDSVNASLNNVNRQTSLFIEDATRARCPGLSKGTAHGTHLNMNFNAVGFTVKQLAIMPEIAKMVDEYFDMFGYATNRVKIPNMDSRPNWNYVKTKDVIIKGSMPVEAMATIKAMFNNGVRFWHNGVTRDFSLYNGVSK